MGSYQVRAFSGSSPKWNAAAEGVFLFSGERLYFLGRGNLLGAIKAINTVSRDQVGQILAKTGLNMNPFYKKVILGGLVINYAEYRQFDARSFLKN
mgnify:CR=1 FL=1